MQAHDQPETRSAAPCIPAPCSIRLPLLTLLFPQWESKRHTLLPVISAPKFSAVGPTLHLNSQPQSISSLPSAIGRRVRPVPHRPSAPPRSSVLSRSLVPQVRACVSGRSWKGCACLTSDRGIRHPTLTRAGVGHTTHELTSPQARSEHPHEPASSATLTGAAFPVPAAPHGHWPCLAPRNPVAGP